MSIVENKFTNNVVLLIGGNGFIGSHVLDILRLHRFRIKILSAHNEKYRLPFKDVEYITFDYGNKHILAEALTDVNTVVHLAHSVTPKVSFLDPLNEAIPNLTKFLNLLEIIKNKNIRLIFLSSGGTIYGNSGLETINENSSNWPISPYGVVKLAMERYLYMYAHNFNISYVILRPSNVYGERSNYEGDQGLIPILITRIINNERIHIWGNGEVVRDYVYVSDLARLVFMLITKPNIEGVFNVGSGIGYSINEVIDKILEFTYPFRRNLIEYNSARSFDVEKVILDITKIKDAINWEPEVSLSDGIKLTSEWLKNRLSKLN